MFTIPLARGNPQAALSQPNSAVLSSEAARRYFGTQNPVGRRLAVEIDDEEREMRVAGVAEPLPAASSIRFDVLLPFENKKYTFPEGPFRQLMLTRWEMGIFNTYVWLPKGVEAAKLEAKLPDFVSQHYGDEAGSVQLQLQPLTDVHLDPDVSGGLTPATAPLHSYILAGIALLVLGLACINFTTLSLGRSAGRLRKVGIRKAVGAASRWPRSSGARPC